MFKNSEKLANMYMYYDLTCDNHQRFIRYFQNAFVKSGDNVKTLDDLEGERTISIREKVETFNMKDFSMMASYILSDDNHKKLDHLIYKHRRFEFLSIDSDDCLFISSIGQKCYFITFTI